MLALDIWELLGCVATVIGLSLAFFVFFLEQIHARNSVEAGTCRLFDGNCPGEPGPVASLLARIALPENSRQQIQQSSTHACSRSARKLFNATAGTPC